MDADGLPIVGAGIDYARVGPFNQKRTLAFLNHFLIRTTSFLNHFATVCDERLEKLLIRIQRLEASMGILEAKLTSIPGLESVTIQSQQSASNQISQDNPQPAPEATLPPPPSQSQPEQDTATTENSRTADEEEKPKLAPIAQDPRFAKYFKMVNLGIPVAAVKIKMSSEGVDPNLLDNPEAPAPPGESAKPSQDSDSDSSSFDDD